MYDITELEKLKSIRVPIESEETMNNMKELFASSSETLKEVEENTKSLMNSLSLKPEHKMILLSMIADMKLIQSISGDFIVNGYYDGRMIVIPQIHNEISEKLDKIKRWYGVW